MLTGAMPGLLQQSGMDVIVLTEELDEQEFFCSRITRQETLRLLGVMAYTAHDLPVPVREQLAEIDWPAWAALPEALIRPSEQPFKIWVAARELAPLTVQQLIDYRRVHPGLFPRRLLRPINSRSRFHLRLAVQCQNSRTPPRFRPGAILIQSTPPP